MILARIDHGMAYSKVDEDKNKQSSLPERRKRVAPIDIRNYLRCRKLKLHFYHTASNSNRVSSRHLQRVYCQKCFALYQICQGLNLRLAIDIT